MICMNCLSAGKALSLNDPELAKKLHERCADPETCTCQHRIDPNMINKERIQKDDAVPASDSESQ